MNLDCSRALGLCCVSDRHKGIEQEDLNLAFIPAPDIIHKLFLDPSLNTGMRGHLMRGVCFPLSHENPPQLDSIS